MLGPCKALGHAASLCNYQQIFLMDTQRAWGQRNGNESNLFDISMSGLLFAICLCHPLFYYF